MKMEWAAKRCPHAEDAFPECEPCHIRRLEREVDAALTAAAHATTDGIATGLSRALVAIERRLSICTVAGHCVACMETRGCIAEVRSLLEATADP